MLSSQVLLCRLLSFHSRRPRLAAIDLGPAFQKRLPELVSDCVRDLLGPVLKQVFKLAQLVHLTDDVQAAYQAVQHIQLGGALIPAVL